MKLRLVFVTLAILLAVSAASSAAAPRGKIKLLFLTGGGAHDFKNLPPILKSVLDKTGDFDVTLTEDRDELTPARISRYDEILIYTQGGDPTPEQEKGLTEFVAGGKGCVGIHCATDTFTKSDAYWKLAGGRFVGHGSGTFDVKITGKRHPIVRGMSDFSITDESYRHKFSSEAKVMVLARRPMDGEPVAWVQDYGRGRAFFTGLGHGREAWENKSFQELVVRGLRWAVGLEPVKTPAGDTVESSPSK